MSPRNQSRRGSVLVIVAALAAVMMATFAVVISQVQSEVSEGELLVRDAQARIMLPSALSFVLESARLGQTFDGESFGWTDIRDGGIGPRGPRDQNGNLPAELTESSSGGLSAWPAPGGIYRADMHLWNRTPYAIRSEASYNPVKVPSEWLVEYEAAADAAKGDTLLGGILGPGYSVNASSDPLTRVSADKDTSATQGYWTTDIPVLNDSGHKYHWNRVWLRLLAPFTQWDDPDHQGMLVPQPVTDDWDSYATGDKTVRPASGGIGWFRVYREKAADHDGDGWPWYDTVPLNGHGVFIITCGGGGTLGYRNWAEVPSDVRSSAFLGDETFFNELRATERILWYRVQWKGFTGGAGDGVERYRITVDRKGEGSQAFSSFSNIHTRTWGLDDYRNSHGHEDYSHFHPNSPLPMINTLGTITFVERLEREPDTW
jgi:hypothetical protein